MARSIINRLKSGVEEVSEGLPLARRGLRSLARKENRMPPHLRGKRQIRDMQQRHRREMRKRQLEALNRATK